MSQTLVVSPGVAVRLRDLVELGKPRLSMLVVFTAGIGVWMGPNPWGWARTAGFLMATSMLVAAANTLNCWLEREIDALMARTRGRPLPARRMEPRIAFVSGSVLAVISLSALAAWTNLVTMLLGFTALVSYVLIYTPLKRVTPWAVVVGAVPGALPPLMGWTAAQGSLGVGGLYAFGILFLWQLPHFIAIAIYLMDDFRRGGIRVLPWVHGHRVAVVWVRLSAALLAAFTLTAAPWGLAGTAYTLTAAVLGGGFLLATLVPTGPAREDVVLWARRVFGASLLYLPVVLTALVLDSALR